MIVEAKDVKFFEIAEVKTAAGPAVRIKGLVFHSSLAVQRIDQRKVGGDLILEVVLTPAKQGLSGSFTVEVPLSAGIERIVFGPSAVQVWPSERSHARPLGH